MPKRKPSQAPTNSPAKRQRQTQNDEEEEEEDAEAITVPQVQKREVGIVERIVLRNFMCHGILDVKLGPHVNFIIGRNGSGKSAVVTGLVVGLGGLASVTNRGNKVRSFVKTGKQMAEVEIQLCNKGPDAYQHDVYGDSIIVQRKIYVDGGTRYQLKSERGKLVSDKLEELKKVKDFFNIQVENPVAILNQDTSRNFLHSKSPYDKYKFFLKATQLEQMKEQYDEANASKEKTSHGIHQYEKTLPALKNEVLRWEEKFKNLGTLSDLKDKVIKLKNEMAWAFVCQKEKSIEPVEKVYRSEEARLPKFKQKAEESKTKVEECQSQLKTVQAQLLTVTEEAERMKPLWEQKREVLNSTKQALRNAQSEYRNIGRDLRNAVSERQQIQERIQELQQTVEHNYEAERVARQEKARGLEEQVRAAEARRRTTQHELDKFQGAVSKYKNEIYSVSRDEQAKAREKTLCEKSLQTLLAARSNRFKRFGNWVPSVLSKIDQWDRQGKFHKKPRGPLGACFQLKDQSWALGIESCLKSLIHCFVCHDHHDEKLLEQILQQESGIRRRPAIITCPFKDSMHDVSRFRVRNSPYPAVLDIIECEDPVVMNALIDQRGIENVILIPEAPEARNVMMNRPPQNCKEAFTREGDHMYCSPTFRNYSSDMNNARFLTSNVEEEIQSQNEIVQRLAHELMELQQQCQALQREINVNQREEKKCETQLMKLTEAHNNLKYELNELKSIEDPVPVDITTLEEDVENYSQQIQGLEEQSAAAAAALTERKAQCQDAEREFKDIEAQMEARANSDIPLKDKLNGAQTALEEAQRHKKHYQARLQEQQTSLNKQKEKIATLHKELEEDVSKASQIFADRIKTLRTPADIEREIKHINSRIRQEEESQGNPVEITQRYQETKNRYQEILKEVKGFKKFIQKLDMALQKRTEAYHHLQRLLGTRLQMSFHRCLGMRNFNGSMKIDYNSGKLELMSLERVMCRRNQAYAEFKRMIALRTKYFFIIMLSHRQYIGRMTFSHESQSLEMWVAPTENSEVNKDLKALSGGERSFSTVCFILSLWNAMESPFRCLDEFDVYMDLVNRRISMEMMLQMTRSQTSKQFIFLTPQDMSQLSNSVIGRPRIFQMPDPDRSHSQLTLPFKKRTLNQGEEEDDE